MTYYQKSEELRIKQPNYIKLSYISTLPKNYGLTKKVPVTKKKKEFIAGFKLFTSFG